MTKLLRTIIGRGRTTLICPACGIEFTRPNCHIRGETNACSRKCAEQIKPRKQKTMIDYICKECGKPFQTRKGRGGTGDFCSIQCLAIARGRKMAGQNHPKWNGGSSKRKYESRKTIYQLIEERMKCEECGAADRLQGHHIKCHSSHPSERANPANIQVLCINCHANKHPKLAKFILAGKVHA